jgi:AraC family transcriptional regulator
VGHRALVWAWLGRGFDPGFAPPPGPGRRLRSPFYFFTGLLTAARNTLKPLKTNLLHIKNMVCPRCVEAVHNLLERAGYRPTVVTLGVAELDETTPADPEALAPLLHDAGFELLRGRAEQLTEQIKSVLADYLEHLRTARSPLTTSAFLTDRFAATYSHLSKVFSRTAHLTIEKYLIRLKIERVKELLSYGELTLNQIADQMRYSSGQHLSNQFRQVTGYSVSEFRRLMLPERVSLDALA